MAQTVAIGAERRSDRGKGAARRLRAAGRIPAVIYGHGRESEALSLVEADFERVMQDVQVGTTVFDIAIEGSSVPALVREVQRHPSKADILHVDFYEIHAGEKLTLEVPIHLIGSPDGVRNAGGVLDQVLREVTIRVLPRDIPERLELDVTALRVGQSLHVSDLQITDAEVLTERKKTICTVIAPRVEEEEVVAPEEVEEEVTEPELIRKEREEAEEGEDEED
jgi:large subunit ribosomal protein L25